MLAIFTGSYFFQRKEKKTPKEDVKESQGVATSSYEETPTVWMLMIYDRIEIFSACVRVCERACVRACVLTNKKIYPTCNSRIKINLDNIVMSPSVI